jgi:hypothetical protein
MALAFVSVQFEVDDSTDVNAIVAGWGLPEGAVVSGSVSTPLTGGKVGGDGALEPPPVPEEPS